MSRKIIIETNDGQYPVNVADDVSDEMVQQWVDENAGQLDKGAIANPISAVGESAIQSTGQSIAGLGRLLPGFVGDAFEAAGEGIEGMVPSFLETNPLRQQYLGTKIGAGLGSIAPVIGTGGAGMAGRAALKLTGKIAKKAPSIMGASAGGLMAGENEARQAEAAGASELDVMKTFLANAGIVVSSEYLLGAPVGALKKMVGNDNAVSLLRAKLFKSYKDKGIAKIARGTAAGFAGEAAQESIQQLGANLVAGNIYDPNRRATEGIGEAALVGGMVGGIVGTAGGAFAVSMDETDKMLKDVEEILDEVEQIEDPEERDVFVEQMVADISDLDESDFPDPEPQPGPETPQSGQVAVKGPVGDPPTITFQEYIESQRRQAEIAMTRGFTLAPKLPDIPRQPLMLAAPAEGKVEVLPVGEKTLEVASKAMKAEPGPALLASLLNTDGTLNLNAIEEQSDGTKKGKLSLMRKVFRDNDELASVDVPKKSADGYIAALQDYLAPTPTPEPTPTPTPAPTPEPEPVTASGLDRLREHVVSRFQELYAESGLLLDKQRRKEDKVEWTYKGVPLAVTWQPGKGGATILVNPAKFQEAIDQGADINAMLYEEVLHTAVVKNLGDAEPELMAEIARHFESTPGTIAELTRLRPDLDPNNLGAAAAREYTRMILQSDNGKVTEGQQDLPRPKKGSKLYNNLKNLADRLMRNGDEVLSWKVSEFIGRIENFKQLVSLLDARDLKQLESAGLRVENAKASHIDKHLIPAMQTRSNNPQFIKKMQAMAEALATASTEEEIKAAKQPVLDDLAGTLRGRITNEKTAEFRKAAKGEGEVSDAEAGDGFTTQESDRQAFQQFEEDQRNDFEIRFDAKIGLIAKAFGLDPEFVLAKALQEVSASNGMPIWETEVFSNVHESDWLSVAARLYESEVDRFNAWAQENSQVIEAWAGQAGLTAEEASTLYKDSLRRVLQIDEIAAVGISRQFDRDIIEDWLPEFVREMASDDVTRYEYDKMDLDKLLTSMRSKIRAEGIPEEMIWHHTKTLEKDGAIEPLTPAEETALIFVALNANMREASRQRKQGDKGAAKIYDKRIDAILTAKALHSVASGQGLRAFFYAKILTAEHWVAQADQMVEHKNGINKKGLKRWWRKFIQGNGRGGSGLAGAAAQAAGDVKVKLPPKAAAKRKKRQKATQESLDFLNQHRMAAIGRLRDKLVSGGVDVNQGGAVSLFFSRLVKDLGNAIKENRGATPRAATAESKTEQLVNLLTNARHGDPIEVKAVIDGVRAELEKIAADDNDMRVTEADLVYLDEMLGNIADRPFSSQLGKAVVREALEQLDLDIPKIARQSINASDADWGTVRQKVRKQLEQSVPSHIDALMGDLEQMIQKAIERADRPRPSSSREFKDQIASSIIARAKSAKKDSPERMLIARFVKLVNQDGETRSTVETIQHAIRNAAQYQTAIQEAREFVAREYKYNPDTLAEANAMFDDLSPLPVRDSDIRATIRSSVDIDALIQQHYSLRGQASKSLATKLVEDAGLSVEDASELESMIAKQIGEMIAKRKSDTLNSFVKSFEKARKRGKSKADPKKSTARLVKMVNLGILDEHKAWDLYREEIELPQLKEEDKAWIADEVAKISKETNSGMRTVMTQRMAAKLNAKIGYSKLDLYKAAWYSSALSGISTTPVAALLGNFAGTTTLMATIAGQRLINGDFGGLKRIASIAADGFMGGTKEFIGAATEGRLADDSLRAGPDTFETLFRYGDLNPALKGAAILGAIPGRLLSAVDAGLQYGLERTLLDSMSYDVAREILEQEGKDPTPQEVAIKAAEITDEIGLSGEDGILQQIQEQAEQRGLKEGSEGYKEFVAAGLDDVLREMSPSGRFDDRNLIKQQLTYRNPPTGLVGKFVGHFDEVFRTLEASPNRLTQAAAITARLKFMPFARTMANIINDTLAYTPLVGFAKHYKKQPRDPDLKEWGFNKTLTMQREMAIAKTTIGTVGFGLGVLGMMLDGLFEDDGDDPFFSVLGNGPDDPKAAEFIRNSGRSQNAIRFGALSLKYSEFPAASGLFALLGTVNDYLKFTPDSEQEQTTKLGLFAQLAKQHYLAMGSDMPWAGILRDMSMLATGRKTGSDFAAETVVATVPRINALNQAYDFYATIAGKPAMDRSAPKLSDSERFLEQLAISRATPIARMFGWGDPKYDAFGDPLDASMPPSRFFDLDKDTDEITGTLIDNGLYIPFSKSLMILDQETGKRRRMGMDELLLFRRERGQRLKKLLKSNLGRLQEMDQALAQERVTKLARDADVFGKRRVESQAP